jgi:hypothetical protein
MFIELASIWTLTSCKYAMRFKYNNTPYMYFVPWGIYEELLYTSYRRKKSNKNKFSTPKIISRKP